MDKPLSKWTLWEAKSYCESRGQKYGCCKGCLFSDDREECVIAAVPEEWDIVAENTNVPDKPAKPRMAEVLGVEVGEKFLVQGSILTYIVDEYGVIKSADTSDICKSLIAFTAINHPESITRAPRLTEAELAICKAAGAKWVSCNLYGVVRIINLWDGKPGHYDNNQSYEFVDTKTAHKIASFYTGFDSVGEGDCICVEEAHNDD